MSKRKTPVLRFKGFHNDWEQRKLGDIATPIKTYSLTRAFETLKNTNFKYIHYGDIHTGKAKIIQNPSTLPTIKKNDNYITLKTNDIIIADASEDYKGIADAAILKDCGNYKIVAGLHTIAIRPNSCNVSSFIYILLGRDDFKHWGYKVGTGLKVFGITLKNFLKYKISYPSLNEQKAISKLLNLIDNLLVLQKRKYEELKLIKKFLLQNMFADKVPYPNLRFNNFTSEWKLQYLGKLFRRNNERNKKNIFKIDHTITVSKMKFNINGNGAAPTSICTYKVLRTGDVAFEGNRHTKYPFGQLIINDIGDGIMSPRFASIRPKYKLNISYWKYFLHYEPLVHNILVMSTKSGTLMNELVYSDLFKQNIFLPENSEQIKIGKILNIIDYKINLQKRYILKLKSIKNFLLQNMFV